MFSGFNVFLAVIMYLFNRKVNKNILYLTSFIFLYSFENSMQAYFIFGGDPDFYPYVFLNYNFLYLLKAPMLYFFVRGLVKEKFYFHKKDLLHFIPAAIQFANNIPYYLTPFSYKQKVAAIVLNDMEAFKSIDLMTFFPNTWSNIFRAIQLFVYVLAAFVLLAKTRKLFKNQSLTAQVQYHYVSTWIKILLIVILMLTTIHLITGFIYTFTDKTGYTTDWMSILLYLAIYVYFALPVYVILNPRMLYGFKDFRPGNVSSPIDIFFNGKNDAKTSVHHHDKLETFNERMHTGKKKTNINLHPDQKFSEGTDDLNNSQVEHTHTGNEPKRLHDKEMEKLTSDILIFIEESKIFLNVDFQVKDICVALKVPQHHVQFCLNEILGKKFSDLKNEYRIQYAMDLFLTRGNELSVEGVGHLSGFASNSNFYTTFKQFTGFTPNQWVKQNIR